MKFLHHKTEILIVRLKKNEGIVYKQTPFFLFTLRQKSNKLLNKVVQPLSQFVTLEA